MSAGAASFQSPLLARAHPPPQVGAGRRADGQGDAGAELGWLREALKSGTHQPRPLASERAGVCLALGCTWDFVPHALTSSQPRRLPRSQPPPAVTRCHLLLPAAAAPPRQAPAATLPQGPEAVLKPSGTTQHSVLKTMGLQPGRGAGRRPTANTTSCVSRPNPAPHPPAATPKARLQGPLEVPSLRLLWPHGLPY